MPRRRRVREPHALWYDEDLVNLVVKAGGEWSAVPLRGVNRLTRRVAKQHPVDAVKLVAPPLEVYRRCPFYTRDMKLRLDNLQTFDPDLAERVQSDGTLSKWALNASVIRPQCISQQRLCLRVHTTPTVLQKLGVPVEYTFKCCGGGNARMYDQRRVLRDIVAYTDGLWGLLARRHRLLQGRRCVFKLTPPAAQTRAVHEFVDLLDSAGGSPALSAFCTSARRAMVLNALTCIPAVPYAPDYFHQARVLTDGSWWPGHESEESGSLGSYSPTSPTYSPTSPTPSHDE